MSRLKLNEYAHAMAERLASYLRGHCDTQADLVNYAIRWGTTARALKRFVEGDPAHFDIRTYRNIAHDLDCTMEELLEYADFAGTIPGYVRKVEDLVGAPLSATARLEVRGPHYSKKDFGNKNIILRNNGPTVWLVPDRPVRIPTGVKLFDSANYMLDFDCHFSYCWSKVERDQWGVRVLLERRRSLNERIKPGQAIGYLNMALRGGIDPLVEFVK